MEGRAIFWVLIILFVYFLPTVLAIGNRKQNSGAIFCLNLFLGWSLIGWVVSLVWAVSHDNSDADATSSIAPSTPKPIPSSTGEDSKKCPFCAETIKKDAVVCRFCGRDLPADEKAGPSRATGASKDPLTSIATEKHLVMGGDKSATPGAAIERGNLNKSDHSGLIGFISVVGGVLLIGILLIFSAHYYYSESSPPQKISRIPIPPIRTTESTVRELSSEQIKDFQTQLKSAGFDPGAADGVMGSNTKLALKDFQTKHGLPVSGRFDKKTAEAMQVLLDKEPSPSSTQASKLAEPKIVAETTRVEKQSPSSRKPQKRDEEKSVASAETEEREYTTAQIQGCHKIMADAEKLTVHILRVRGGIPYEFYINANFWANRSYQEKQQFITALSTCKHVLHGERAIHIKDSRTGKELGKMGLFGPKIFK